jgi:hypothetical protein
MIFFLDSFWLTLFGFLNSSWLSLLMYDWFIFFKQKLFVLALWDGIILLFPYSLHDNLATMFLS